jgi:hypothetical protein
MGDTSRPTLTWRQVHQLSFAARGTCGSLEPVALTHLNAKTVDKSLVLTYLSADDVSTSAERSTHETDQARAQKPADRAPRASFVTSNIMQHSAGGDKQRFVGTARTLPMPVRHPKKRRCGPATALCAGSLTLWHHSPDHAPAFDMQCAVVNSADTLGEV